MTIAEGIYNGLSADDYHAADGVSHSMLKHMHPTPAHLQAYMAEKHEPTPEMILGTLVHQTILEPDRPLPALAVKPADMKFSTREGKAWQDNELRTGKLIITQAEFEALKGISASIATHPACRTLFAAGKSEVSLFRGYEFGGGKVLRKARIDFVPEGDALADIKTCQDASPEAFAKTVWDMRYFTQAAYYLDVWNSSQEVKKERFVFVAVEKDPPWLVAVYELDKEAIKVGRGENLNDLVTYMDCAESGKWPGYSDRVEKLSLPGWALKKAEIKQVAPRKPSSPLEP